MSQTSSSCEDGRGGADAGLIDFVTLSFYTLDDIQLGAEKPVLQKVMGGAGTYAALGALLIAGREQGKRVSHIVDAGNDFPAEHRAELQRWGTNACFKEHQDRLTVRAWNGYNGQDESSSFKWLTPKFQLTADDLNSSQLLSNSFHLISSAGRCASLVDSIVRKRQNIQTGNASLLTQPRPLIVWEPVPGFCTPDHYDEIVKTCPLVDVISPNALELNGFLGISSEWDPSIPAHRAAAYKIVSSGIGPSGNGLLVVRRGADGCTLLMRTKAQPLSVPAFKCEKVGDPTGGGNCFMGALTLALAVPHCSSVTTTIARISHAANWKDVREGEYGDSLQLVAALICANVAASYVIEQIGMPKPAHGNVWNGVDFYDRLDDYIKRRVP